MVDTTPPESVDPALEAYDKLSPPVEGDGLLRLIQEHFIYQCYSGTARAFAKATNMALEDPSESGDTTMTPASSTDKVDDEGDLEMGDSNTDLAPAVRPPLEAYKKAQATAMRSLDARKHLYSLIMAGQVRQAVDYCNETFPQALAGTTPESVDMCFQLQCQQFIEYVRKSAPDALQFAQDGRIELGKFGYVDSKYMETLQDVVALIAYADPASSPVAKYLSDVRREETATNLNSYILTFEGALPTTAMERLIKQATLVRDVLNAEASKDKKSTKPVYPKWQLGSFIGTEAS